MRKGDYIASPSYDEGYWICQVLDAETNELKYLTKVSDKYSAEKALKNLSRRSLKVKYDYNSELEVVEE